MADVNANIGVQIDTSAALAELKNLQRQLANFHSSVSKSSAAAAMAQKGLQTNLLNAINATGKFRAQMGLVRTSTESFTHALETNKLSMREYFRYAGGSTRTFGRLFKQEFNTIGKVAEERVKKMQTQYIKMGRDASGAMKAIAITPNTLNMKEYSTQLAVAAQKQALLNQLLKQGSTNLLNFGKNTQWAGRQLMVGFTIPLAYFGTAAAKTFMDLEKQAIRFKRVYGDMFTTTDETNKALADIQQLAEEFTKYGVAVVDTIEMAANAAAMGKTGAELTAQVAQATRLAVLGGVEQAQALETTISVTNAFGIAADELANKINFLNAVENQTVVSIEDLTIAIPKAGPVVKQLGGSVEDLAFFLTAMKEGGINASEGANALKSGLASLINPTDKASKMLAGMGINIKAIVEGNAGNIRETVIDFAQALDTLDPLNRARAIEQLFGKFQFSRLSTLFQNVTKDGTQAARVLELAGASIEELAILSERELGVLEDAIGTDFRESVEKLKLAIAPIGKTFLEAVTPIVKVIGRLLEKFNNLGDGTKKFLVVATTLVGVIGPVLLMTFGLLANGVANIIKLFITMRSGFLRAGTNTNLLAQQTQYLNSEQLEAATVAASLNQAHTRLTQSFSAETTAVRLLRQAYIDATIAATNFARANPGMMMPGGKFSPPKKFARGVTEVPGSGNKDTVASMLTPGEAVIPAPVAQDDRFKPLIAALVSGEIKQYKKGVTSAGDDYAHVGGMKNMDIDKLLQDPRISALEKQKLATYRQILISQGKPTIIPSYGSLAYSFDPALNKAMAKGGVPFSSFEAAWTSRGPDKWISSNIPASQASVVDSAILKQIKASGVTKVTDAMVDQAFKNLPPEIKSSSGYTQMSALHSQLGSYGIGRGLGSNPKTSEAILQEAKKKGYIKDYKIETRTTSKGTLGTKSIIITNLDGTQVNLGRGSKTNRQYISDTQDTRRKSGIITGQSSRAKSPALSVVGGGSSDVRQVAVGKNESILNKKTTSTLRSGKSVFVPGMGRLGLIGADDGIPGGQTRAGVRNIPFSSASGMRVPESQMNRLIESLDKNTKVTDDGTQTTTKLAKEQKREVRAQRAGAVGRVAGPVAGIAGIGAMAGFMTGNNNIGMAMMGISALATIAPMLTNPLGLFVAGLVAVTAMIWKMNRDVEKARQEGVNLAKSMNMTSEKLKNLSVITNTVSATEAADRRRQTTLTGQSAVQRKFGQNVLGSDFGKGLIADIEKQAKVGQSVQQIGENLSNSLAYAIVQGVVTTEQARSIAAALGQELQSYEIPAIVSGKLTTLLGPNGENLATDPLQVTLAIQEESMQKQADFFKTALENIQPTGFNSTATILGATGVGAAGGAAIGSTAFGIGAIPGAILGGTVGAIGGIGAAYSMKGPKEENAKLGAAALQLGLEQVTMNNGLVDALNKQYDIKVKMAKTDAEIKKIEEERKSALDTLNAKNAEALKLLISQKDAFGPDIFKKGIDAAVNSLYKEGPMKVFADQAIKDLEGITNSDFKAFVQIEFASGSLDPVTVSKLAKNKELQTKFTLLAEQKGSENANMILQLLMKSGVSDTNLPIFMDIINNDPKNFDKNLKAIEVISNMEQKYGIRLDLNTNGEKKFEATKKILDDLVGMPEEITKDGLLDLKVKDPKTYNAIMANWNTLVGTSDTINRTVIIDFVTSQDDNVLMQYLTTKGLTNLPYSMQYLRARYGEEAAAWNVGRQGKIKNKIPGDEDDSSSGGKEDTTLNELLKKLKLTRDASINAQGGLKELRRVMKNAGGDLKVFNGLNQALAKMGAESDFINFIGGMDNALEAAYVNADKLKQGIIELTDDGILAMKAYQEAQIGAFSVTAALGITETIKQRDAFVKLTAAGVSAADALEMMADSNFMLSIAQRAGTEEVKDLIEQYNLLKSTVKTTQDIINPEKSFKDLMDENMKYYDFLEREARAQYEPQIESLNKLIDTNERLIDVQQRVIEENYDRPIALLNQQTTLLNQDLNLIDKAAESINKKYDEQEKALQKISDIQDEIANKEKGRITIADALTRGDISAAAKAIQEERQAAAKRAQERSSNLLQVAREKELAGLRSSSGLTRAQIEEKIYGISQQIFKLEQDKLPIVTKIQELNDANYNIQVKQLQPLKDELQTRINNINAARTAWESQMLAIEKAKYEASGYNKILELGEGILKRIKALWDSLTAKAADAAVIKVVQQKTETVGFDEHIATKSILAKANKEYFEKQIFPKVESGSLGGSELLDYAKAFTQAYGTKYMPYATGGMVPKYYVSGGYSRGTDTIPAMLTPGEFVVRKNAVDSFGVNNLNKINDGLHGGSSVYNYNLNVNVKSESNPDDIARTVMTQIKRIDNQRIKIQRGA